MPKHRTALEKAAGRLVSSVQKVWILELGEDEAASSERALEQAHLLLQAAAAGELRAVLGARSVEEFLGELWVLQHPTTYQAIQAFKLELMSER
ncbi:MAG: hypothetical protein ACOVKS_06990 [Aquimonas sp.]|jgi:hypothetical protein